MALDTVKELLSFDCGSLVAYQLDKNSQLDSISFQTVLMRNIFVHFPDVVFIHRTHSPSGKALYVFMVDGPFLKLPGEMTKVIHFAVPAKETAESLAHMYRTFKAFNPEWRKIKTFLVDPHFRLLQTLSEAFPSAEVQLSVFHVCKHLQQKIHQMSLECISERLILNALRNTMCAATESNLRMMHTILSDFVKPDLLPQLHTHWLLNDKIWAMHRWRNWMECNQYFKDLEIITRGLSQVFCTGLSLETCITSLAKHYQNCVSKRPPDAVLFSVNPLSSTTSTETVFQSVPAEHSPTTSHNPQIALQNHPAQSSPPVSPSLTTANQKWPGQKSIPNPLVLIPHPLPAPQSPLLLQNQSSAPQVFPFQNQSAQHSPSVSLNLTAAHQIWPGQNSLSNSMVVLQNPLPTPQNPLLLQNQLANPPSPLDHLPHEIKVEIITEDSKSGQDVECNQETEDRIRQSLRDICTEPAARLCLNEFAVAQKSVQLMGTNEDIVNIQILEDTHKVQQRGLKSCTCHFRQAFQLPCRHILAVLNSDKKVLEPEMLSKQWQKEPNVSQAEQNGTDGLLEVLKSSWNESLDKSLAVSFLTAEISRLLTHCSSEEFERRYSTLRELADSWIGPYVQVKL
ncbi:zinc finger SWIM domain-containing protein 1 isoform X1 [Pelodiscus sinensis]|uniref:zinc finger SWIM domain-containing protein 1 isoform X1 n=2 Tax=Pelodiscus sinensis TaxID=13735 RepID=UPI0003C4D1FF|nr:zinc finger SWIM domain-containing protein 1 [Pelodiscus sinensis]|eukprot:XP_006127228.1 zinc finger SWIM domain-containing protein 1 [Pelodiscus sinensis]